MGESPGRQGIPPPPRIRTMTTSPLDSPELGDTLLEERTTVTNDDGDHERFAHYVDKAKIVESAVTGIPVKALCGKVWVPGRDPSRYPICPDCERIFKNLRPGES